MYKSVTADDAYFLKGGGEMGALIRSKDWAVTSLGAPDTWPQPLKIAISLVLRSAYPMFIWWGEERIMFHNDAYIAVLEKKHPHALGSKAQETWAEIWDQVGPMSERVFEGEQVFFNDLLLFLRRKGFLEETYFTFSYSPILNADGTVGGLFCACSEETGKMLGQRRLKALAEISNISFEHRHEDAVCDAFINILSQNNGDIPFSAVYLFDETNTVAQLKGSTGTTHLFPESFNSSTNANGVWKFKEVLETGRPVMIQETISQLNLVEGFLNKAGKPESAITIPLQKGSQEQYIGILVFGISCHLEFTRDYESFLTLVASQFTAAIGNVRALEEERKRAKAMAEIDKAKTAFYSNLFMQAPVAISILKGRDFIVELANDLILEIWGKPLEQVLNKPVFEGLPEAREQGLEVLLEKVYDTGVPFVGNGFPVELMRNSKLETVYLNFVYEALRRVDGTIEGVIAVASDVTEHVVARKKVEESEARFKLLADEMPQLIFTGDREGNITYFNKAVYDYSGLPLGEPADKNLMERIHSDDREANKAAWIRSVSTGESFIFEQRLLSGNGEYRWFLSRAVAQKNSNGEIQIWIGTSTDIHDQKMMAEVLEKRVEERTLELKMANEELIRTNHELEQFAYVSSHDLQEPLRKIQTFSHLLLTNIDNEAFDKKRYLEKINAAGGRMSALIKDLLNFSRLSNTAERFVNTDLNEVLRNVTDDFEVLINQKGAVIKSSMLPVIEAIPIQINQLFHNLISNSLKFTETSPLIQVSASVLPYHEVQKHPELSTDKSYLKLVFKDNGIGFDDKYTSKIFTIFQRLNNREKYSGTGIGLAICRKIVENHKGFISAKGELNKGATFTIYLPFLH